MQIPPLIKRGFLCYNQNMKLYNQISKQVEEFKPQDPKNVKIYTCGPTVYSFAHIGNFTSYIYWDLLVRTIKLNGWTPNRVLNLTDVGHLTSDADEGEDKLEKGARREGKTVWEIAKMYSEAFLKDFRRLNLVEPDKICPATEYIEEQKALVDRLTENGYTYETSDGIYFDTVKFKDYAVFARLDLEQLKAGARVAFSSEKHHAADFAVWKFIKDGENHAMRWDYLGRPGYPGWHLECSAICHAVLGEPLDIHAGGIDHIPVHHTNEIAQTACAYGEPLARFWTHCNFITIEGKKVSKSLGNTFTLDELAVKGFDPLDFKLWVLQGHYQSERNFSFADLEGAKNRRRAWLNRYALALQSDFADNADFRGKIKLAIDDNLNSPLAFSIIDQTENLTVEDWQFIDEIFGLGITTEIKAPSPEILEKIATREQARLAKDFAKADALRAEISASGYVVLDAPSGPKWQLT